ncbi:MULTISPECIES: STAS domain-containing protein [unclassified Streptomyces]|uniref:STAS domain-containing protein n=1 Tax=unclassified Streptomyces TaxID=2593676 RepID=UPI002E125B79|nr:MULTISPECIES: STAS domain-containing protein [unclassified Streptomyces]WSR23744.1 STAS domain-containing protein [Streptomyces sp. NBC_01205]
MADQEDRDPGVWLDSGEHQVVVHVGGEMDIDRAPMLYAALHAAITQTGGPNEVIIDLSELSFCDSSGLNALIQARHTADEQGRHISLRDPQPQFRRLLEVTGAENLFPITDT